jgi:RHS repeat-associated protein
LESYTYDVYGTPTFYNASGTQISGTANGISMLYTGQRWHTEIGFYDNRNRFYHPGLGRFLQPDPIGFAGDSANLYRYCGNNPANWSDPSGLVFGWDDAALFVGGGVIGIIGQGVHDALAGQVSGWQSYTGAFIGGGVGGVALEYGGPLAAGGLGAMTGDMVTQELNMAFGDQQSYDPMQTIVNTGIGTALGVIPGPKGTTNSDQAIAKQVLTKFRNKTINRIKPRTGVKVARGLLKGSNALPSTVGGVIIGTALPPNPYTNSTENIPEIPVTAQFDANGNMTQMTVYDPNENITDKGE